MNYRLAIAIIEPIMCYTMLAYNDSLIHPLNYPFPNPNPHPILKQQRIHFPRTNRLFRQSIQKRRI